MRVYVFRPVEGAEIVVPAPLTGDLLVDRAGIRQGDAWSPSPVTLAREDDGRQLVPVDCPFLSAALPVVKDEALDRIVDLLAADCELLALDCPQTPLTAVNVVTVVDAMDEQASDTRRFPDGRLMMVKRYAFRPQLVPDTGLFKVPQALNATTFCTEGTAEALQARLTGLNLQVAWEG